MVNIVGVRFKKAGKIYYFDPLDLDINSDDAVIVETARGVEFGLISIGPKEVNETRVVAPLKPSSAKLRKGHQIHMKNLEKKRTLALGRKSKPSWI